MTRGYPDPSSKGMRFNFSSPLDMSRVTCKHMRVEERMRNVKSFSIVPKCHAYFMHASEIKPCYDTIVEIYGGVNTGVDQPIEHRATTQMRMMLHLAIF